MNISITLDLISSDKPSRACFGNNENRLTGNQSESWVPIFVAHTAQYARWLITTTKLTQTYLYQLLSAANNQYNTRCFSYRRSRHLSVLDVVISTFAKPAKQHLYVETGPSILRVAYAKPMIMDDVIKASVV